MSQEGRLYTIKEVAEELGISDVTLYNWINDGTITAVPTHEGKLYQKPRITQATLDYLRVHVIPPDQRQRAKGPTGPALKHLLKKSGT